MTLGIVKSPRRLAYHTREPESNFVEDEPSRFMGDCVLQDWPCKQPVQQIGRHLAAELELSLGTISQLPSYNGPGSDGPEVRVRRVNRL